MSQTRQPRWKFLANLGDVNPLDYGGLFVYRDATGVYPEEIERLELVSEEGKRDIYEVHRVVLEKCTFINGVLSDNEFHPEFPAWFADDLAGVSSSMDYPIDELRGDFCSEDPLKRANAWRAVLDYHGWANGDSEPRKLTRSECWKRYRKGELA